VAASGYESCDRRTTGNLCAGFPIDSCGMLRHQLEKALAQMKLALGCISLLIVLIAHAEADHALRTILGVSALQLTLPTEASGAKFEVTCFYYEKGQGKRSAGMTLDGKAGESAELLWKGEGKQTRLVLTIGQQTRSASLPATFDGVGAGANNEESVPLGDGWIGRSFFTFSQLPAGPIPSTPTTVLTLDKLEKMTRDPARRTIILAYRRKIPHG
jgi:hypothetical protein